MWEWIKSLFVKRQSTAQNAKSVRRVTTKTVPDESTVESEMLENKIIIGSMAEVSVQYGMTLALATKFEFARIDVGVRVPCNNEDKDKAYDEAREWATSKIKFEVKSIRESEKKKVDAKKDPAL